MSSTPRSVSNASPSNTEGLEKFFRRFFVKAAQVVIQSRQNDKVCTRSNGHPSSNEWFSLNINEEAEIHKWAKKNWDSSVLANTTPAFFLYNAPLCIEISLHTSEGDRLVLEQWVFSLRQPEGEDTHPDHFNDTIYNRLSILLKSVVAVSRALPAYKYARNQNCDSYVFMYQVYAHEPASSSLGKEYRSNSIGHVVTGMGVLSLRVDYRTSMTIVPSSSSFTSNSPMHAAAGGAATAALSDPITFRHAAQQQQQQQLDNRYFRPRCPSSSSNRISDESEERGGGGGGNLTSDDSQDRIFQVDSLNTPQHQSNERRRKSSFGSGNIPTTSSEDKEQQGEVGQLKFGAFARLSIHEGGQAPSGVQRKESDPIMNLFQVGEDEEEEEKNKKEQQQQQQQQQQQPPSVKQKAERKVSGAGASPSNSSLGSREDLRPRTASTSSRRSLGVNMAEGGLAGTPPKSRMSPFLPGPSAAAKAREEFEFLELKTPFSAAAGATAADAAATAADLEASATSSGIAHDLGVFFKGGAAAAAAMDTIAEGMTASTTSEGFSTDKQGASATSSEAFQTSLIDEICAFESKQAEMDEMIKNLDTESESEQ